MDQRPHSQQETEQRSTAVINEHTNIAYEITDDELVIRVRLDKCIGQRPASQNYVIAQSHGYEELFVIRDGQPEKSGLFFQLYLFAKRGSNRSGINSRFVQRIRDLWPKLEESAQAFIEKAEADPELGR
jgi:hypothetical protein